MYCQILIRGNVERQQSELSYFVTDTTSPAYQVLRAWDRFRNLISCKPGARAAQREYRPEILTVQKTVQKRPSADILPVSYRG